MEYFWNLEELVEFGEIFKGFVVLYCEFKGIFLKVLIVLQRF